MNILMQEIRQFEQSLRNGILIGRAPYISIIAPGSTETIIVNIRKQLSMNTHIDWLGDMGQMVRVYASGDISSAQSACIEQIYGFIPEFQLIKIP